MAPIRYERVRFQDGGKPRAVFLRIVSETKRFVTGVEVDKYGEEIEPPGHDQRIRMIDLDAVISRRIYVMDLHYGELVPAPRNHNAA